MPFVKVMIHAVWGTKNRELFLTSEIRPLVIEHIKENAQLKRYTSTQSMATRNICIACSD